MVFYFDILICPDNGIKRPWGKLARGFRKQNSAINLWIHAPRHWHQWRANAALYFRIMAEGGVAKAEGCGRGWGGGSGIRWVLLCQSLQKACDQGLACPGFSVGPPPSQPVADWSALPWICPCRLFWSQPHRCHNPEQTESQSQGKFSLPPLHPSTPPPLSPVPGLA